MPQLDRTQIKAVLDSDGAIWHPSRDNGGAVLFHDGRDGHRNISVRGILESAEENTVLGRRTHRERYEVFEMHERRVC